MKLRYKFAVLFFITSKLYIRVAVIMLCKKYISPMNNVTKGEGVISIFFPTYRKVITITNNHSPFTSKLFP